VLTATLVSLALVFAGTWLVGGYSDTECFELYADLPELAQVDKEVRLWPPGTKCHYQLPNGTEQSRSHLPWFEWIVLALSGAAAYLVSALWHRFAKSPPPESNRQPLHYK
jgi:hypothetical protein